ncbi:MAG: hypothetical protein ACRCST_15205 [Turicibacter sp.]
MKVLNGLLIVCALLLFFIGIETKPQEPALDSIIKLENPLFHADLRPNLEIVIDQLYPM